MQPRSRSERHALQHKEELEKARLRNRTGGYHRYEDVGAPTGVRSEPLCPSYLPEGERFMTTAEVASRNSLEQDRERVARNEFHERRRQARVEREETRWQAEAAKDQQASLKAQHLQEDPVCGKKNESGQPYDIVNLGYHPSEEGRRLAHSDDMVKYRGDLRALHLAARNHLGYNPITGEQKLNMDLPPRPMPR